MVVIRQPLFDIHNEQLKMTSLQILYVAFGYRYLVMAINSVRSARQAGTLSHTKLITNIPLKDVILDGHVVFDDIVILKAHATENRQTKIRILDYADGPACLFLDCDTEVNYPLHKFAPLLSKFDIALRDTKGRTKSEFEVADGSTSIDTAISELNTGVFFFSDTCATRELFALWKKFFEEMGVRRDQPSFLRSFIHAPTVRLFPLGAGWNAIPVPSLDLDFMQRLPEEIRILHYKDPIYWPSVGSNLGYVHRRAELQFLERGAPLEREIDAFGAIAHYYEQALFRHDLGRRLINWRLRKAAARNGWGPIRL